MRAPQISSKTSRLFRVCLPKRVCHLRVLLHNAKMRPKAHLGKARFASASRKSDAGPQSVVQGVIQRNFSIQHLRNRAARFGFVDDLIKGIVINTWQRNGAG